MKMRIKILLLCLGSTLFALSLQTILFQQASTELIYEQAKAESFSTLQNMQNELYGFVKNIEGNLIKIYNNKLFLEELKENDIEALRDNNYRIANDIATENFQTSDNVVALYVYNGSHEIISTYRRAMTPKHNYPKDIYEDEVMYNTNKVKEYIASDEKYMLVSSYYNVSREKSIARLVLKIYEDTSIKKITGYIVCDIDSKAFDKIMEKYHSQEEMVIWVQPYQDRQIVEIGTLETSNKDYYNKNIRKIEEGTLEAVSESSEGKRVIFKVEQNKYNLDAYSIMPQAILEKNQKILNRNLILIVAIMSVIIVIISTWLTLGLTKPLEQLTKTIAKIKLGNTNQRVAYQKKDEIGRLGQDFNEMLDEIERLVFIKYEDELLLNKAEYKALQAQINPHFLYNTLDTMGSIASIQECPLVSQLCDSLSDIFRYSLDMKHSFSTVSKEIIHLKNYLYVMNVRMNDSIEYKFDIDEHILDYSLPRISIQPIVENAINHGLRDNEKEKIIHIRAVALDEILEITVEDNGKGMDVIDINKRLMENKQHEVEQGDSIGLLNINARIKMLYGNRFGLKVDSVLGQGTKVALTMPSLKVDEV